MVVNGNAGDPGDGDRPAEPNVTLSGVETFPAAIRLTIEGAA